MTKKQDILRDPIPEWLMKGYTRAISPLIRIAIKGNINPNTFTILGFITSCIAALILAAGDLRLSACILLAAGFFDTLDGNYARASGRVTRFGALFDSTLDRYSEMIYYFGMAFYFLRLEWYVSSVAVAAALGGSLMVSYVRARAEALSFECKIGFLQRPERVLLLAAGGLIHRYIFAGAVWFVAIFSNFTAVQRILYIRNQDMKKNDYNAINREHKETLS